MGRVEKREGKGGPSGARKRMAKRSRALLSRSVIGYLTSDSYMYAPLIENPPSVPQAGPQFHAPSPPDFVGLTQTLQHSTMMDFHPDSPHGADYGASFDTCEDEAPLQQDHHVSNIFLVAPLPSIQTSTPSTRKRKTALEKYGHLKGTGAQTRGAKQGTRAKRRRFKVDMPNSVNY
uniref:Myomegalin n=1 Tax=Anthurium amnicola TaxID=1678845 RepID=A0A1D1XVL8_9ARAE